MYKEIRESPPKKFGYKGFDKLKRLYQAGKIIVTIVEYSTILGA